MNNLMIHGRVNREPYYRAAQGDKRAVLVVDVEVSERNERKSFFKCKLFGPRADEYSIAFSENDHVIVQGSVELDTYNKDYPKLAVGVQSIFKVSGGFDPSVLAPAPAPAEEDAGLDF